MPSASQPTRQPAEFSLLLYRGDTYAWQFTFWSDSLKTVPLDLTGVTAKAEIRDKPSGTVLAALDCALVLPNVISATLPSSASQNLQPAAIWDLQLTFSTGEIVTMIAGRVTTTLDVTDSSVAPSV